MKPTVKTTLWDGLIMMRTIELRDIETLRIWKNIHKEFFFLKMDITEEEQLNWFNQFMTRTNDYMFIINDNENMIGCVGTRLFQGYVDVYNVILGDKNYAGRHIMMRAVEATIIFCNLLYKGTPVRVRVLKNNPAIKWYEKLGFKTIDFFEDYVLMQFDINNIKTTYIFNIEIELPNL